MSETPFIIQGSAEWIWVGLSAWNTTIILTNKLLTFARILRHLLCHLFLSLACFYFFLLKFRLHSRKLLLKNKKFFFRSPDSSKCKFFFWRLFDLKYLFTKKLLFFSLYLQQFGLGFQMNLNLLVFIRCQHLVNVFLN